MNNLEEFRYAVVYRSNPSIRLSKTFTRKGDAKAYRRKRFKDDTKRYKIATYKLILMEES
ncbi:hypothetical protein D307_gp114 [Bacillus phage Bastille]|uniref:Uncharacterized protein n=1 Tax=Bacillus phage Bastille TaxID=57477 RepID=J9PLR4_9CAUD|nr:hypothetical protein D307_gp114 [Bacillus phage Bastille]AEQ34350.1 hypothetical protein [Bacillus phage Bastille]